MLIFLHGTTGATEAWALLSGLGLRCKIADFEGTFLPAGEALTTWLEEYFLKGQDASGTAPGHGGSVDLCNAFGFQFTSNSWLKGAGGEEPCRAWGAAWRASAEGALPPVFLQHNTHSRTVIGMVRSTNGSLNLLMLDPAKHFTSKDLDKPDWEVLIGV